MFYVLGLLKRQTFSGFSWNFAQLDILNYFIQTLEMAFINDEKSHKSIILSK